MSKFKVGDIVRRTSEGLRVTIGETYKALRVYDDVVSVENDRGKVEDYLEDYFQLVVPEDPQQQQHNPVSKPSHYNVADGIECITYIKQVLGNEGFVAYCRGNQVKYQHRAMYKGNPIEDLEKAHQYNAWAIETLKELPDEQK